MTRIMLAATAAAMLAFAAPALSQDAAMAESPQDFVQKATISNMFEIESSKLALEQAQGEEVKAFAQKMVDDHTKAAEEMKTAAEAEGVTEMPQELDDKHKQKMTELSGASDNFDSTYVDMQVAAHEEAVALFEDYSKKDGELADFAEKTLPTLQQHLEEAQGLDK